MVSKYRKKVRRDTPAALTISSTVTPSNPRSKKSRRAASAIVSSRSGFVALSQGQARGSPMGQSYSGVLYPMSHRHLAAI